jgi:NAD(P)-dependent dehydrogenase (short-subunit alcohol dehydrogenase family)
MRTLEGKTALVTGGGEEVGRAIALALSARGVRVIVMGPEERALAETVGEIAHGGGKARHLAGDVRDPAHLAAGVGRALEVFGGLDIVIAATGVSRMDAQYTFNAAIPRMVGPGCLIAIDGSGGAATAGGPDVEGLCGALAEELAARKITCHCVVPGGLSEAELVQHVVQLCGALPMSMSARVL